MSPDEARRAAADMENVSAYSRGRFASEPLAATLKAYASQAEVIEAARAAIVAKDECFDLLAKNASDNLIDAVRGRVFEALADIEEALTCMEQSHD